MTGPDAQRVVPMIAYRNGIAALEWLVRAFGFEERARWLGDNGDLTHGELVAGGGLIMLAAPTPHYEGPRLHRRHCAATAAWSDVPWVIDGVLVYVDDIEAHFDRARAHGATVLSPVEQGPDGLRYRAEDIEGHRWMFVERG